MRHIKGIKERISLLAGISVFLLMLSASAATAGSISGMKFNDLNRDGIKTAGEPGIEGWPIAVFGSGYFSSITTGPGGSYTFSGLGAGTYFVVEDPQSWVQTYPSSGGYYTLNLAGDVTGINFGNYDPSISPPPPSSGVEGKMTGEGSVLAIDGTRVKYEFELNCDIADKKHSELEVNWGKNKFHLEDLTSASCTDEPGIDPEKPSAGFDTYTGGGTGRYNKMSGYTASWIFTDAGKSGKDDVDAASIKIYDTDGNLILEASGTGNHKAHNK